MLRRAARVPAALLALWVLPVSPLLAHGGHEHKVMGTVSIIRDIRLEVKETDGKTSTFTLNEKTRILRGSTVVAPSDIKSGDRVVVTTEETKDKSGKAAVMVKEVRLGTAADASTRK